MNRTNSSVNPFYALVVLTGVAFAVTALAYVVALVVSESPRGDVANAGMDSPVLRFFEQRGESLMLWEAGALTVAAVLAMGLDRWRLRTAPRGRPDLQQETARDPTPRE